MSVKAGQAHSAMLHCARDRREHDPYGWRQK
jgi:hypothetical protein